MSEEVSETLKRLLAGDRPTVARLATLVENRDPTARDLLAQIYPHCGRAHLVGVTGAAGTGKSTLVCELAKGLRTRDRTVGIVAIDPTSPFSGGAILGDRIRMQELALDPGVFIRSMATRGAWGGLARATGDVVKVLDAAGYDVIFIETVGAGQSEVDIAKTADTILVVATPGLGDEIQAIKAGLFEIADVFIVNKADREGAETAAAALSYMLDLTNQPSRNAWRPPVMKTVATKGEGTEEVIGTLEEHLSYLRESKELERRVLRRSEEELKRILGEELLKGLLLSLGDQRWQEALRMVAERKMDPYSAARSLLQ